MKSGLRSVLTALCLLLCSSVTLANPTLIGNLATTGVQVSVEIDGVVVASPLAYLEFRQIDVPPGRHRTRLLDASTGAVLVDERAGEDWEVLPDWPQHLILLNSRIGDNIPYVWSRSRPRSLQRDYPSGVTGTFNWIGASTTNRHVAEIECPDSEVGGSTRTTLFGGGRVDFASFFVIPGGVEENPCRMYIRLETNGVGRVYPPLDVSFEDGGIHHYLFDIGDGSEAAPFDLLMVRDGVRVNVPYLRVPDSLRRVKSPNYWYDNGRSAQGIALYEASRTQAVHGIWNLFTANGRPRWLYLDGGVVDASGRREVVLYEYTKQPGSPRTGKTVGQGTLTYLSCNLAELQVQFADGSIRAAQFRRSVEVSSCAAMP